MRARGVVPDPHLKRYGRGGMSPGYAERYQIVLKLRDKYFRENGVTAESPNENIKAMPLETLNNELHKERLDWRARINEDNYYVFYKPDAQ